PLVEEKEWYLRNVAYQPLNAAEKTAKDAAWMARDREAAVKRLDDAQRAMKAVDDQIVEQQSRIATLEAKDTAAAVVKRADSQEILQRVRVIADTLTPGQVLGVGMPPAGHAFPDAWKALDDVIPGDVHSLLEGDYLKSILDGLDHTQLYSAGTE